MDPLAQGLGRLGRGIAFGAGALARARMEQQQIRQSAESLERQARLEAAAMEGHPYALALAGASPVWQETEGGGLMNVYDAEWRDTPEGVLERARIAAETRGTAIGNDLMIRAGAGDPNAGWALGRTHRFGLSPTGAVVNYSAGTVGDTPESIAERARIAAETRGTAIGNDLMNRAGAGDPNAGWALGRPARFGFSPTGAVLDYSAGTVGDTPESIAERADIAADVAANRQRFEAGQALLAGGDPMTVYTGARPPGASAGAAAAPGLKPLTENQVMTQARAQVAMLYKDFGALFNPLTGEIDGLNPEKSTEAAWLVTTIARNHIAAAARAMREGTPIPSMPLSVEWTLTNLGFPRPSFSGGRGVEAPAAEAPGFWNGFLGRIFGGEAEDERGTAPADALRAPPGGPDHAGGPEDPADPLGLNRFRPPR